MRVRSLCGSSVDEYGSCVLLTSGMSPSFTGSSKQLVVLLPASGNKEGMKHNPRKHVVSRRNLVCTPEG